MRWGDPWASADGSPLLPGQLSGGQPQRTAQGLPQTGRSQEKAQFVLVEKGGSEERAPETSCNGA